ncbi:MAG: hypothetical protein LBF04_02090 [Prevotellaceae bacterium]|jgi:hypothetical protein|nr:hypothetical protein [Prevotellaceae bacterium]
MTAFEFVKTFFPFYNEERERLQKSKPQCNQQEIDSLMIDEYFAEALAHCLRRQRELCAVEYYHNAEDTNWIIYVKIKQAKEPQNYGI